MVKVSRPADVLWVSSAGPVVIKLLQERNGQKMTTNLQSIVILKQKKVKGNIGNGCTNTVEKSVDLRLRSTENKKTDARK